MAIRKAFTLIELLVVVAIIALLMAILVPALQRVKKQAGAVACQSNLKQMGYVFTLYTEDYNGLFHKEHGSDPRNSWVPAMRPYYSHEPEIRNCPMVHRFYSDGGPSGIEGCFVGWGVYGQNGYATPSWAIEGDYGSYGLNWWVCSEESTVEDAEKFWRTIHVKRQYRIPVFVDAQWVDALPKPTDSMDIVN